ncbi:MAG: hypothetical protein BWK73_48500 [Thiothrix lacustris]|uniref:Uncharacterized protein n=1 Tax=Thiothrix lacustris TaxID=525917 RepID=A0A1Y1Q9B1_9GAMM|nr:MAG: hypothetical protein BWK73_48500 [Thiothrix lacustris]
MADQELGDECLPNKGQLILRNRSAAPHLRAIGPVDVRGVRGAGLLAQICGTAEQLPAGSNARFSPTR